MSRARQVGLIAAREVREAARSKTMRITTAVLFLAALAITVVPRLVGGDGTERIELGVDDALPAAVRAELEQLDGPVDFGDDEVVISVEAVRDTDAAEVAVRDGDLDAAVVDSGEGPSSVSVVVRDDVGTAAAALADEAARRAELRRALAAAELPDERVRDVLDAPTPGRVVVASEEDEGREFLAFLVSLTLYLALLMAGQMLAASVAVEKSSHIAETLLTVLRPGQLLAGKVLGIGAVVLTQLLVISTPVLVGVVVGGGLDLPSSTPVDVLGGIGWFLLGYAVYGCTFAALGALVERQEQVGGAVAPLTMLLIGGYLIGLSAQGDPDGGLVVAASYFPLTAPLVMPVRVADGAVGTVEVAIAVGLGLLAAAALVRVGATVYRRAIIRGGRRLKLREVLAG